MPELPPYNCARSAVLIIDYQPLILSRAGAPDQILLATAKHILKQAREAGIQVIYVRSVFRPDYPEVSPRNFQFKALKSSGLFLEGPDAEIDARIAPETGDVVIVKRRVNAFFGTDLDLILRAKQIETLILLGVSTSGAVLSTVRYASDADYGLIVLRDCCFDHNNDTHACLVETVFPRQATVLTAAEFLEDLSRRVAAEN